MNLEVRPGPPADHADRLAAQQMHHLVKQELPRVREAALAWRNGVGVLLAGLVGFGLIKGRTDVTQLASPYDAVAGVVLLASLLSGTVAALLLLRAAHGRPASVRLHRAAPAAFPGPRSAADHDEALRAADALSRGLLLCLLCTALLVSAVGITWYGPGKERPGMEVVTPAGVQCGEVVRIRGGRLTLKVDSGEVVIDLRRATGIRAVESCTPAQP
ncbi:hypothetical protein ACIOK4_43620 [Streptomyces bottropensis]|uniref:hypothetical protein n=1 Tax=Streptomyces bottropensis TaxID=42235 RepID=UPI0038290FB4